jgi:HD superfamily phosphodiesterase
MQDKLVGEMKNVFGSDKKRINHALAVLGYAKQIQAAEGGDPLIVEAAAILHDIGIQEAERKYGSSAGNYQEIEGPPIARKILQNYGLADGIMEHIYKIIANHHSAKDIDTTEFRIVWDAD